MRGFQKNKEPRWTSTVQSALVCERAFRLPLSLRSTAALLCSHRRQGQVGLSAAVGRSSWRTVPRQGRSLAEVLRRERLSFSRLQRRCVRPSTEFPSRRPRRAGGPYLCPAARAATDLANRLHHRRRGLVPRSTTHGLTIRTSAGVAEVVGGGRPNDPGTTANSARFSSAGTPRFAADSPRMSGDRVEPQLWSATNFAFGRGELTTLLSIPPSVSTASRQSVGGNQSRSRDCAEHRDTRRPATTGPTMRGLVVLGHYSSATHASRFGCRFEQKL